MLERWKTKLECSTFFFLGVKIGFYILKNKKSTLFVKKKKKRDQFSDNILEFRWISYENRFMNKLIVEI